MAAPSISYWYDEGIRANKQNTLTLSILKYNMTVMQARITCYAQHSNTVAPIRRKENK
jgi:hypothetical protein